MPDLQIVTVGSNHICPMVTGTVPHVGGPVTGPGCPGVSINGQPIALMGDICVCAGPPDTIVQGYPGIMVNGTPIVVQNAMTAHGGTIPLGVPGVTAGSAAPVKPVNLSIKEISFPKISNFAAVISGHGKELKEAKKNMEEVKESAFLPNINFS
jgi:uncharacterized Zn-binding protein involved in type VI secretion